MNLRGCFVALAGLMVTAQARSDLQNGLYVSAKAAYAQRNWTRAADLLRRYSAADGLYLKAHPDIAGSIQKAIEYCRGSHSESVAATADAIDADAPDAPAAQQPAEPPPGLP